MSEVLPFTLALQEVFHLYSRSLYEVLLHDTVATDIYGERYFISEGTAVYFAHQRIGKRSHQARWNDAVIFPGTQRDPVGEVEKNRPVLRISPCGNGCLVVPEPDMTLLLKSRRVPNRNPKTLRILLDELGL